MIATKRFEPADRAEKPLGTLPSAIEHSAKSAPPSRSPARGPELIHLNEQRASRRVAPPLLAVATANVVLDVWPARFARSRS
jgi:hypothetical protein